MPLKVSFELSDRDLSRFRALMTSVRGRLQELDESQIIAASAQLVKDLEGGDAPEFVRSRVEKLSVMIRMLEDVEWRISGADRSRVLRALVYFAEAEDLIPDRVPVLGFLDDAIMIELVVRELKHELDAYADFCHFRKVKEKVRGKSEDPTTREQWMASRRKQLHARMRRRRSSRRAGVDSGRSRSFRLW